MSRQHRAFSLRVALLSSLAGALGACSGSQKAAPKTARAEPLDLRGAGGERCDAGKAGRDFVEYDTTRDGKPDVRKVVLSLGEGVEARTVMICRETDVDGDGRKDVIRYYDDEGRSLREEADRNLDGKMDLALIFQNGKVIVKEVDEDYDGALDTRIFYSVAGGTTPERAERDLAGRSTPGNFRPDRWEYYDERGRLERMGTDVDGDTRVDRWDRDSARKAAEAAQAQQDTEVVEE